MNYPNRRPTNISGKQNSDAVSGPPKRRDRKVIATMIGVATTIVLILILFAVFTNFPGPPQGDTNEMEAPPADVKK